MDIKTKFALDQTAYFMKENKVDCETVKQMSVAIGPGPYGEGEYRIRCLLSRSTDSAWIDETLLYASKEELLASL